MILGMGGVSQLEDVKRFVEAGANCVQLCTAAMFNPLIAVEIRKQWFGQNGQCGSRALTDRGVRFTDANVALAFERTIEVAKQNPWPVDKVWDSVQNHWARSYRDKLAIACESADAPLKARAQAPTIGEIKEWYLNDLRTKLNAKPSRTAKV